MPDSSWWPPAGTTAVIVVPMPVELTVARGAVDHGGVRTARWRRARTRRTRPTLAALRSRCGSRPRRRGAHPCRRPPRTAARSSSTRNASSLLSRNWPCVGCRSCGELHCAPTSSTVSPTCTRSPFVSIVASVQLVAVDERAVGRAEILDPKVAVPVERAGVHLRDERVERERDAAAAAATHRRLVVDRECLTLLGFRFDDHESPTALAPRPWRRRRCGRRDDSGGNGSARAARAATIHTTRTKNR